MKFIKEYRSGKFSLALAIAFTGLVAMPALAVENHSDEIITIDHDPASERHSTDYRKSNDERYELPYDEAYEEPTKDVVILSLENLADLVGPIALYPDDLLAIVLPASTYPLQIVQAARFLEDYERDNSLQPPDDWDESVIALLNYPEVVEMMNDDLSWTWELGGAVLNQQQDVILAMEDFRDRAYEAGNLRSDDYQTVDYAGDSIEITPVDKEVIYVPYYEPSRVVIRHSRPDYFYYPQPYPVYYYPYPANYSFASGFFWGVTTSFRIGWSSRNLHVHHHSFRGHPYFGHRYARHYYRQPNIYVFNNWYQNNVGRHSQNRYRDGYRWRPRPNNGARPNGNDHHASNNDNRDRPNTAMRDIGNSRIDRRDITNRYRDNQAGGFDRRRPNQRPDTIRDSSNRKPVIRDTGREPSTSPRRPGKDIDLRKRPVTAGDQSRNRYTKPVANRPVANRPNVDRQPVNQQSGPNVMRSDQNRRRVSSERLVSTKPTSFRQATPGQRKPASRQVTPSQRKPATRQATPSQRKPATRQATPSQRKPTARQAPSQRKPSARQAPSQRKPSARQAPPQRKPSARQAPSQRKPAARQAAPSQRKPAAQNKPANRKKSSRTENRSGRSSSKPANGKKQKH